MKNPVPEIRFPAGTIDTTQAEVAKVCKRLHIASLGLGLAHPMGVDRFGKWLVVGALLFGAHTPPAHARRHQGRTSQAQGKARTRAPEIAAAVSAPDWELEYNWFRAYDPQMRATQVRRQELVDRVKARLGASADTYSDDALHAVIGYCSGDYLGINAALRSGDESKLQRLHPYIEYLKQTISLMPAYEGKVFRFASLLPEDLLRYEVGQVVTESSFISTSVSSKPSPGVVGQGFRPNVRYEIVGKSGRSIQSLSPYGGEENEVVFLPGTQFRVVGRLFEKSTTVLILQEV